MEQKSRQEITLIVNEAFVKLRNGKGLIVDSYRVTNQGIYVYAKKTATLFDLPKDQSDEETKICFIPFDEISVIIYSVAKPDTKNNEEDISDTTIDPQG